MLRTSLSQVQPRYSVTGVLLITGALCADAAIGNVQEKTMKGSNVHAAEMIHKSYSMGSVLVLLVCLLHGEMRYACYHCACLLVRPCILYIVLGACLRIPVHPARLHDLRLSPCASPP